MEFSPPCSHKEDIKDVDPSSMDGCEECLKIDGQWVHLRICQICGKVGCCDNSPNKHATGHYHASDPKIIKSFQPGEEWHWCYKDEIMFKVD